MNELTTTRSNPLIDPILHVWHGEVALYLFLGGIVAGIMVLTALWVLRRDLVEPSRALSLLPWAAPVLISVGMFFLWLDLEHPFNAFRFYLVLVPTSPMSWGAWILLAVYPASILQAWITTPAGLRELWLKKASGIPFLTRFSSWALGRERQVALLNIAAGAALGVYTGLLLGTMGARPLWNSAVLGPLFLTSGLSTAAAFMLLGRLSDSERVTLGKLDMGLIVVELLLIGLWLLGMTTGAEVARGAAQAVLGGPFTAAFWTMVVALGLLAPLAAEWMEHRNRMIPGRAAAVLVLVGGFALRWILVFGGQYSGWIGQIALQ